MATGTISWVAPIQGLDLLPIEIKGGQLAISKIELRTESESRLTITCTLEGVSHENCAINVTHGAVELLINRLAFEFSCQIGEPRCYCWSPPTDSKANQQVILHSFAKAYTIIEGTIRPGQKKLSELIPDLEQPEGQRDCYIPFYRFSAAQRDPVTRFMFLYNLLLLLAKDEQKAVDCCILCIDPKVPKTQSPRNQGCETLFTRLRNQVAHSRPNTDQVTTANEVAQNVAWFQNIVRKVILSVPQDALEARKLC